MSPRCSYRCALGEANDAFIHSAVDLGERAIRDALERASIEPRDIRHLFFVSVTGLATPSIDARLMNRMNLRSDVKRTPIFGLGCAAGAAGIARAADSLRAFPGEVAGRRRPQEATPWEHFLGEGRSSPPAEPLIASYDAISRTEWLFTAIHARTPGVRPRAVTAPGVSRASHEVAGSVVSSRSVKSAPTRSAAMTCAA